MKRTALTSGVTFWRIMGATCAANLLISVACPTVDSHAVYGSHAHLFPELGWREPVSLLESGWAVDRLLVGKHLNAYNCHYYTKTFVEQRDLDAVPFRALIPAGLEELSAVYLEGWGYRPVKGRVAMPGDIIVAEKPATEGRGHRIYTHSAIVADVDHRGNITRIRQKFDPSHPVVDVTLEDFVRIYVGDAPRTFSIWRKSAGGA